MQVKDIIVEPRTGEDFDRAMESYYDAIARSKGEAAPKATKKAAAKSFFKKAGQKVTTHSKAKTGAVFLAVCRGKVSEGIDLADDNARGVIIVGIPYPNAMDNKEVTSCPATYHADSLRYQVKVKKTYNDNKVGDGLLNGDEWYSLQAFRAINQVLSLRIRRCCPS